MFCVHCGAQQEDGAKFCTQLRQAPGHRGAPYTYIYWKAL